MRPLLIGSLAPSPLWVGGAAAGGGSGGGSGGFPGSAKRWLFAAARTDLAGTTPATSNGDLVRAVPELAGGPALLVTGDGRRPAYRLDLGPGGDLPGVLFTAGTALETAEEIASAATRTAYVVAEIDAATAAVFFSRGAASGVASEYAFYAAPPPSDALVVGGGQLVGVSGQFPTTYGVFAFRIDATTLGAVSIQSYLNGELKKSVVGTYALGGIEKLLGVNTYQFGGASFGGTVRVLEIALVDAADDSTAILAKQAYYAATYGTPA